MFQEIVQHVRIYIFLQKDNKIAINLNRMSCTVSDVFMEGVTKNGSSY